MSKRRLVLHWAMALCILFVVQVAFATAAAASAPELASAPVVGPAPPATAAPNAAEQAAASPEPVFLNLAWGDSVAKMGASRRVGGDATDPLAVYVKTDEVSRLGPLDVNAIHYMFFAGHLMAIEVLCQDAATVESILKAKYGKPFASSPVDHSGRWLQGDTLAALTADLLDSNATLLLASVSLSARYEAWKKGHNDLTNAW